MNPSTSSRVRQRFGLNDSIRPLFRPILVFLFVMTLYHTLVVSGVLPSSEGLSIQQSNIIKVEQYAYSQSPYEILVAGSSRTAKIEADYFGKERVANVGIRGGSSQTGLELVKRSHSKPSILLLEANGTLIQGVNRELIEAAYHPILYFIRLYFPMFRQEYQPVAVAIEIIKNWKGITAEKIENQRVNELRRNPQMREKRLKQAIEQRREGLNEKQKNKLTRVAQNLKKQIVKLEKQGVRVILFDVPGDPLVDRTPERKQEKELMRKLFPPETYEWLPEHPSRDWMTTDGVHLIRADARDYAAFILNYLGSF